MSTTTKTIIIVVALIIIGGLIFAGHSANQNSTNGIPNSMSATTTDESTSPSDASDAAVIKDTQQIDAQMNGLNNDSATANQGLNDRPITQ